MMFARPGGGTVRLADGVVEELTARRQKTADRPESGGILLGRLIDGAQDVVVDAASTPGAADKKSRFRFFRAREPAQRVVDDAWKTSAGVQMYLGEWHTHPEPIPTPSAIDLDNWRRISRSAQYETAFLLFAIIGTEQIRFWELVRGGTVAALAPIDPLGSEGTKHGIN